MKNNPSATNANTRPSPLSKLYARQQPKLKVTASTTKLLKVFSDDDHKAIAKLIAKWVDAK